MFPDWLFLALLIPWTFAKSESAGDAARISRRLVDVSPNSVATMATLDDNGQPFALQEYYASCHLNGSLTLLFMPISRHSHNIRNGSAVSITVASQKPSASQPRVSLTGNVTVFDDHSPQNEYDLRTCYLAKHPDARRWLPHDDRAAHVSYWARFDPEKIYFVGGFGDKHFIGPVPLHLYQTSAPALPHRLALVEQI